VIKSSSISKGKDASDKLSLKDRTEISKKRILDAAVDVFSEHGFHRFRVREVALRVGLTEAGVLHHFASKQVLLQEVLAYREVSSNQVIANLEKKRGEVALRDLYKVAESIVAEPRRLQLYLLLEVEGLTPNGPTKGYFSSRNELNRNALVKHMREGQQDGVFREDVNLGVLAREAVAFMDGIGLQWLTEGQTFDLVEAYRSYFEELIWRITK
jgi:AcrR family transcriptional regulator